MRLLGIVIGFGAALLAVRRLRAAAREEFVPGDEFHRGPRRVYEGDLGPSTVVKRAAQMARVAYAPAHPNPAAEGPDAGQGTTLVRWIFSEEPGTAEGLLRSGIAFMHDTVLPPGASVGLHGHSVEEIYYILAGEGTMRLLCGDRQIEIQLRSGDAQLTRPREAHSLRNDGAADLRCLVIGAHPRRP